MERVGETFKMLNWCEYLSEGNLDILLVSPYDLITCIQGLWKLAAVMTESLLVNFEKENVTNENNNLQTDKSLYV